MMIEIFRFLKRLFYKYDVQYPGCLIQVNFDDNRIWIKTSKNQTKSLFWKELIGVAIQTYINEPRSPEVFWILGANKSFLIYPDTAIGEIEMLKRLQELPGFSNEAVLSAMSCNEDKTFICWKRKDFSLKLKCLIKDQIQGV